MLTTFLAQPFSRLSPQKHSERVAEIGGASEEARLAAERRSGAKQCGVRPTDLRAATASLDIKLRSNRQGDEGTCEAVGPAVQLHHTGSTRPSALLTMRQALLCCAPSPQDIFGVLVPKCFHKISLRLQALDPRLYQSACYPRCGCEYDDANVTARTHGHLMPGVEPLPQEGRNHRHVCDPTRWDRWLLRHFSCSGTTEQKAYFMKEFAEGHREKRPADITKTWPQSPLPAPAPGPLAPAPAPSPTA